MEIRLPMCERHSVRRSSRTTRAPTPNQSAEQRRIHERGTNDRRIPTEGTIAYLITLDDGYRIMYRDSGGAVTPFETAAMAAIGGVDLALVATSAAILPALTSQQAVEYTRTYRPAAFMPAHHDASVNELWRPSGAALHSDQRGRPLDRDHFEALSRADLF